MLLGFAATFLSNSYGAPTMLFALLLGMAFNFLGQNKEFLTGLEFSSKSLLKVGVALLGARITFSELTQLGFLPLVAVVVMMFLVIFFGVILGRIFKAESSTGLLTGGAVAICGASATVAIASVLSSRIKNNQIVALTIIGVTSLSTLSMIIYPIIAHHLELTDRQTGFLLGATIHDVAQVVGAGYGVSEEAGNMATIVKLFRVTLLAPIVFLIAVIFREKNNSKAATFPIPAFLLIFLLLMLANSLKLLPPEVFVLLGALSKWFLVFAIAAIGSKIQLKEFADIGLKSILLILAESIFSLLLGIAVVSLI